MNYPKWVVLQITEYCNLRCKMCYEWGENGSYLDKKSLHNLSSSKIEEIFEDLSNKNTYFELFGGEPLMHPDFKHIMELVKKYSCKIDIPTNGTLLSKYAEEIVSAQVRRIWISLDGPEEINDAQRGKDVYKRATEGIKKLQSLKKQYNSEYPWIGTTFVLTPLNYTYLKSFVENELIPLNLDYISIEFQLYLTQQRYDDYLEYLSKDLNMSSKSVASGLIRDLKDFENIDLDELIYQVKEARKLILDNNIKLIGYPNYIEKDNLKYFYSGNWDMMKEKKKNCAFPWVYMEVSANGDVTPCHTFYDFKMGNVYDKRILDIWNDSKYLSFRNHLKKGITPLCCACSRYYDKPEDRK